MTSSGSSPAKILAQWFAVIATMAATFKANEVMAAGCFGMVKLYTQPMSRKIRFHRPLLIALGCVAFCAVARLGLDLWLVTTGSGVEFWGITPGIPKEPPASPETLVYRLGILGGNALFAAVVEELIFRGALFRGLRNFLERFTVSAVVWAAVLSSALFALAHALDPALLAEPSAGVWIALAAKVTQAFGFAMIMAALCQSSGTLWIPMVVHGLFDLLYFSVPVLWFGALPTTYGVTDPWNLGYILLSALLMVGGAAVGSKALTHSPDEPSRVVKPRV